MAQQIYEYKVDVYKEPLLGSLFFGESKVDPEKFERFLNDYARQGWEVVTIERETRRALLFFSREAFLTIMKRAK